MTWPTKTEKDRQMTMMIKVTMHLKDIQSYNASRRRLNIARTALVTLKVKGHYECYNCCSTTTTTSIFEITNYHPVKIRSHCWNPEIGRTGRTLTWAPWTWRRWRRTFTTNSLSFGCLVSLMRIGQKWFDLTMRNICVLVSKVLALQFKGERYL